MDDRDYHEMLLELLNSLVREAKTVALIEQTELRISRQDN